MGKETPENMQMSTGVPLGPAPPRASAQPAMATPLPALLPQQALLNAGAESSPGPAGWGTHTKLGLSPSSSLHLTTPRS